MVLTGLLEGNRRDIYPFLPSVVNMGAADGSKMGKVLMLSVLLQTSQNCPFVILLCLTPGDITVPLQGSSLWAYLLICLPKTFLFYSVKFTHQVRASGWERVNSMGNEVYVIISIYTVQH